MSTLADRFLDDFNDVDESLINLNTNNNETTKTTTTSNNSLSNDFLDDMGESDEDENMDEAQDEDGEKVDPNDLLLGDQDDLMINDEMIEKKQNDLIKKYKDAPIESIAKLNGSPRLAQLLDRIDNQMMKPLPEKGVKTGQDSEEHKLIVDCNQMAQEIQHEIYLIHKFVRDRYSKKFPELESSVQNALDYINVVKRIKNENDLSSVELNDLLPKSTIMVLLVTLSSTTGKNLTEEDLKKVLDACEMGLELDSKKKRILNYLESRMSYIAPNLSVLLGSSIASKLIGIAGSIIQLSVIPAGHLQTFGADKKSLAGFSGINNRKFQSGLISQCDIIKQAPPHLQVKAIRVLTCKVSLAARIDAQQESSFYGEMGRQYRDKVLADIEKWQEPPPQKQEKALPAPDDRPKKRRGGARARRYKEKYKVTDIQKAKNRMAFNVEEKTIGDTGIGLGMLGGESGRVRLVAQEKGILKKQKKFEQKSYGGTGTQTSISGLSSVAITPAQGLQLQVSQNTREQSNKTEKYFSSTGFKRK
ncbi:hypothetical protein DICPUDRAFT_155821 [Dictyostelium purpureum]|uniref:Nop domain-containing protein n=1 Tax=Dictyostelium purpureum TaxID=5786 RepID=F0ZUZ5_DICPU|nr:uncharacterized protein DICPUDRAFT_155821 [Dictyostelium purpureum]EGC32244.1 hypothetical protein DICPUDRAFT_155821 [Dictyostelium purpureum]|eukprot:XP_003291242.1 hypothetical protein DICPUDRAFT_155821 [Dictyostelium purpureum]